MRRLQPPLAVPLALLLSIAGVTAAYADEDDARQTLRPLHAGNGFLNRGLYELAAGEYREFLRLHADHEEAAVARYGLGVSLFRLDRYEEAEAELAPLRRLDGFEYAPAVLIVSGQCELALGDNAGAADSFEAFLAAHPDDALADEATALLVEALYRDGDHAGVDAPGRALLDRWPESPHRERTEFIRGLAAMSRNDLAAAADRFEELLVRTPDGPHAGQASLLLARCWHRLGRQDEAAARYETIIAHGADPQAAEAVYGLALLRHQQGRPADAGRHLDLFLERFPNDALDTDVRILRGRAWFDEGRYDRAFEMFEGLTERDGPRADEVAYWLAKCELRQDAPARAARRLAAAIERFPRSTLLAEMQYDRAVALVRCDDPAGALATLDGFPARFTGHPLVPEAVHLMAAAEHDRAEYEASLGWCRAFERDFPTHELRAQVDFLAAENEFLPARHEAAAAAFTAFLERHADDDQADVARYRLGMALYHLERDEAALGHLAAIATAHGDDPTFELARFALGDLHFRNGEWAEAERFLLAYLAGAEGRPAADDARLKVGLARLRQERPEEALAAFDRLLQDHDDSPHRTQARFERGQALLALDRGDEAAASFETMLGEAPGSRFAPYALNHLGAVAHEAGRFDEAAAYFERVAATDAPPDVAADAGFQRGQALLAAGRLDASAEAFREMMASHPAHADVPRAQALHAVVRARQGEHEEALDALVGARREHGATLSPQLMAMLLYEQAWCERELDRPGDAEQSYRQLVQITEAGELRLRGMLELAELEADDERYDAAASRLIELRDLLADTDDAPPDVVEQAAYRLGVCDFRLERYERAAEILEAFLGTYPERPLAASAGLLAGEALFRLGRHAPAAARLERLVERFPDGPEHEPGLLRLGECLALLRDWPRSEAMYQRALDGFPDSDQWFQAQFGVAWARENQQQYDEAVSAYRMVVDRHQGPTAARAQFQIGECLFALERHADAVRELLKVEILYAYPEWSAAALYEAGRCFQRLGDPVQARRQFERVRQDHADTEWAELAAQRLDELSRTTLPGHARSPGDDGSTGR